MAMARARSLALQPAKAGLVPDQPRLQSTAAWALFFFLLPIAAWAQGAPSEDELFGDAPAVEAPIVPDEATRDSGLLSGEAGETRVSDEHQELLEKDRLQLGGMLYLRAALGIPQRDARADSRYVTLSTPNLLDVYLDGRPNERVRAFARGRVTWDPAAGYPRGLTDALATAAQLAPAGSAAPTLPDPNAAHALLDQLWLNFDVARTVWVTVGKQPVKFGATRLWNPADVVNATRKNPLDFMDLRTGVTALKARVPLTEEGLNLVVLGTLDQADAVEKVGGVARLEAVFSTVELGLSAAARRGGDPRAALDVSAGVGDVDLTAEVGTTFLTNAAAHRAGLLADDVHLQTSLGLSYTFVYNNDDLCVVGAEGFWNPDQWMARADYAGAFAAMLTGQPTTTPYRPFYLGRYYGAAYVALPGPGTWDDASFTLTTLGNLSDKSFLTRLDATFVVLTYLSVQAYVQGHYGTKGGEFRFGFDSLTVDPGTGTPVTLPVAYPYQMVDLGVNLRVDF